MEQANQIKVEKEMLRKRLSKIEKMYLQRAQEKRFEQQVMQEASKIRQELTLVNKLENQKSIKTNQISKEAKIISKKEKEARKLEQLEAEVLQRLRDTHIKQQEAIEEIQEIFRKHQQNKRSNNEIGESASAQIATASDYNFF